MHDEDKRWIKWIVFAIIIGFLVGKIISVLLDLFLSDMWVLLVNAAIPICLIVALLIVLYFYQREKEKTL